MTEPRIQIEGRALTEAQAMAVRVAVMTLYAEVRTEKGRRDIGPIADAYRDRLVEVLKLMRPVEPESTQEGGNAR